MRSAAIGMAFLGLLAGTANAASLQVAPVLLDLPAPGNTATITLRNTDVEPITAQVRVFRWSQRDGAERLEPTDEVVASPPVVSCVPARTTRCAWSGWPAALPAERRPTGWSSTSCPGRTERRER